MAESFAQLEGLWINAGGPRAVAPVAAAIALAGSRGNPGTVNRNDSNARGGTQSSFGLWQISNGTHSPPVPNILDPSVNASQAVAKFKGAGNSFQPWGEFTSGAYRAFLGNATPDLSAGAGSKAAASGDPSTCAWQVGWGGIPGTSWLADIFGSGGNIGSGEVCLIPKTAVRAMLGGTILAAGGLILGVGLGVILAATQGRKLAPLVIGAVTGGAGARAAGSAAAASRPGERLTAAEVRQANANRRTLTRQRKEEEAAATEQPADAETVTA